MKIYNYHPITKELIGESFADKSPLEKDVFLIPAHATDVEPPEAEEGKTRIFDNGQWYQVDIPMEPEEIPRVLTYEEQLQLQRQQVLRQLAELDNPRDAEALFDVLKAKGVLTDSDLPTETLARFNQKKALRQQLGG